MKLSNTGILALASLFASLAQANPVAPAAIATLTQTTLVTATTTVSTSVSPTTETSVVTATVTTPTTVVSTVTTTGTTPLPTIPVECIVCDGLGIACIAACIAGGPVNPLCDACAAGAIEIYIQCVACIAKYATGGD